MAMGGSTNTVYTLAIAREAGISYDIRTLTKLPKTPYLSNCTFKVFTMHDA